MSLIIYLIIGGIVGWLAGKAVGRSEGVVASVIIGIIGSYIGGFLSRLLISTNQAYLGFSWTGLFWSFIGAVVLTAILNVVQHNSHHHAGV